MNRDVCEHFNPVDLPCDKCKGEAINRDNIIRMAREAGFKPHHSPEMWDITIASDEAIECFAALVAAAERDRLQAGYDRLAFLHTETMAELVRVQRDLDCISANWWELLKHRIKTILGIKAKEDT